MRVKFICLEKLLEMKANDEKIKIVEVLSDENYKKGHIPGAINMPLDKIEGSGSNQLKKNDKIIVYCASYECMGSTQAAKKLLNMGYKNTLDFKAGKKGWIDAGLGLSK